LKIKQKETMAAIFDSNLLITATSGTITIDLVCGYGQPVVTTIYLKKQDGSNSKIKEFDGNATKMELGDSVNMKYQVLQINSTIHDIRDNPSGTENEDIDLFEKVSCNQASVEAHFIKKTTGKGQLINCFYEVTILFG
jgi:hypothetical protein